VYRDLPDSMPRYDASRFRSEKDLKALNRNRQGSLLDFIDDFTVAALHADMMMSSLSNSVAALGDSACVATADGVRIVLISLRNQAIGTDLFSQLGVDLAAMKIIVVKSSQHFHAAYSKVAKHIIYVGAPGVVSADLKSLPYRKIRRPKWPIDSDSFPSGAP
jgi:microcystin degradation protein MlrC